MLETGIIILVSTVLILKFNRLSGVLESGGLPPTYYELLDRLSGYRSCALPLVAVLTYTILGATYLLRDISGIFTIIAFMCTHDYILLGLRPTNQSTCTAIDYGFSNFFELLLTLVLVEHTRWQRGTTHIVSSNFS